MRKTVGSTSASQLIIEEPVTLSMGQIQKITPKRREILEIMYENYHNRPSKPYTSQKELQKKLNVSLQTIVGHIRELEAVNLIKIIKFSELDQKYKYRYDSRTQYLYYVDKPLHELQDKGSFIPTYLSDELK